MGESKCYPVLFLSVLCFLLSEPKTVLCNHDTFDNVVVEWCNATDIYPSRFCEETTIAHSDDLADDVPVGHKDFKFITITDQHIPVLYENSLAHMELRMLEIASCGITDIEVGAFSNTTIDNLNISYNRIDTLRKGIFSDCDIGAELYLIQNGIKTIEDGVFDSMTLSVIDLSRNKLEDISPGVFSNLNVQFISLRGNVLTTIKKYYFQNARILQLLDLRDNQIKTIEPGCFDKLMPRSYVYFQSNLLDTVPEGVFNSKMYVELLFEGNSIKTIMPKALDGTGIGYLNLTGNNIGEINKEIFSNTEMEYLVMASNGIRTIEPGALDQVYKGVDLASNNFKIIKKGTFRCTGIVVLLKNKKLKKIEVGAFDDADGTCNYYTGKAQTLYLEKENLLDRESTDYLRNLTSIGRLDWHYEIDTNIVFPLN